MSTKEGTAVKTAISPPKELTKTITSKNMKQTTTLTPYYIIRWSS